MVVVEALGRDSTEAISQDSTWEAQRSAKCVSNCKMSKSHKFDPIKNQILTGMSKQINVICCTMSNSGGAFLMSVLLHFCSWVVEWRGRNGT